LGFLAGGIGEWLCFVFFQLKNPNFSLITACQNIFCILGVNFLNWLQTVYIATYFDAVIARFSFWSHGILLKYLLSCRKFLVNITSIYTSMTRIYKPVHAVTSIERSHFSCPVIENFMWIEPRLVPLVEQDCLTPTSPGAHGFTPDY
jgi:hypothetical protein